jgi:plastocyanin
LEKEATMNKRTLLAGLLSMLLLVALVAACSSGDGDGGDNGGDGDGGLTIEGKDDFSYAPKTLSVASGSVTITLNNTGAGLEHDITIDQLGVVITAAAGASQSGTFTASAGTYTFYCSVPAHRESGMEGTLTVQ